MGIISITWLQLPRWLWRSSRCSQIRNNFCLIKLFCIGVWKFWRRIVVEFVLFGQVYLMLGTWRISYSRLQFHGKAMKQVPTFIGGSWDRQNELIFSCRSRLASVTTTHYKHRPCVLHKYIKRYGRIARYPVRPITQSALHFIPLQTHSFQHKQDFSGSIQPLCNYCTKTSHSHISTIVYSQVLIYRWTGASRRESDNAQVLKRQKRGNKPGPHR